jgi:hypothetical protein
MRQTRTAIDRCARWLVLAAIVALAALSVIAAKALLADGSYAMLGILKKQGYWDFDRARAHAMVITQTPAVLAIKAGCRDVIVLIYAFSLGLIGVPAFLWVAALAMQWRSCLFWTLLAGFCVTHLTSGFCSIGEYNTAYALTAFCASAMLRPVMGPLASAALVLAALALTRSYESTAYLGPLLAAIAAERLWRRSRDACLAERAGLSGALALFVAGAGVAAWSIAHPRDPENLANAATFSWVLTNGHVILMALVGSIYLAADLCPWRVRAPAIAIGIAASTAYVALPDSWNSAELSYASRTVSGLMLFTLLAVEWFRFRRDCGTGSGNPARALLTLTLFIALTVPALVETYRFGAWLRSYERVAVANDGWIAIDETDAGQDGGYLAGYHWGWTSPSLSIVLRADARAGLLNSASYRGWDPFDPRTLEENPVSDYRRGRGLGSFGMW